MSERSIYLRRPYTSRASKTGCRIHRGSDRYRKQRNWPASVGGTISAQDSWLKEPHMMVYQEKIVPPDPLPMTSEPSDVMLLHRTIKSLKQENAWLKERPARILRDK